jgi:hypothetical protein
VPKHEPVFEKGKDWGEEEEYLVQLFNMDGVSRGDSGSVDREGQRLEYMGRFWVKIAHDKPERLRDWYALQNKAHTKEMSDMAMWVEYRIRCRIRPWSCMPLHALMI